MSEQTHCNSMIDRQNGKGMGLGAKVALMGACSVLVTAVALVILAVWQSGQYNKLAQSEVELLINADLDHITQGVYNLVRTENEAVQAQVDYNLNVARHFLTNTGSVRLADETVQWKALNQFTNEFEELELPRFLIGEKWLGQNTNPAFKTPIVDDVTRLVGETATIFQRMNDRGDMLRVATTVKTTDDKRAIGTYIPAVNPDGSNNPVISAILNGKTYHGRAYVVNAWYLTAYEPIKDKNGNLVGMLYVGIKQKTVASRVRHAILQTRVGKTGYVYVLGGKGADRGRYIISSEGKRDGENIWSSTNGDGRYIIREIIDKAITLKPGEMTMVRYRWQNPGESESRRKVVHLAYYAPWDWVIGTSVYEDELLAYHSLLTEGRLRMTHVMSAAGIFITLLVGIVGILVTWSITHPVRHITEVAEKISKGDLDQFVNVKSYDEIGILARTFNLMTCKLKQSIERLRESEEKYRGIFENALEGLYQSTIEGRFLNTNPAMAHILGYDSPEDLIETLADIRQQLYVNQDDRDTLVFNILNKDKTSVMEVQVYRKDSSKIWVTIGARLISDDSGKPAFVEGFLMDINDRKQAEEALKETKRLEARLSQAQKMEAIGTLAGGIAHDFNNILSAIIGYTELALNDIMLNQDNPPMNKLQVKLNEVLKAGDRAKELTKQILTFSRMTETEYSPIELRVVMKESIKMLRSVIPSTIEIRENLAVPGLVMSDPTQINQIMLNLCTNAVYAMNEIGGGVLEVGLQEVTIDDAAVAQGLDLSPGDYVKLLIRDTGKGISREIMDRIFEPYFTTKEPEGGTGLGLSVIHGIIKSYHGTITCKSILNEGTLFEVYLPGLKATPPATSLKPDMPLPMGSERILFVDDEFVLVNLYVTMLSSLGYEVDSRTSSLDALELFREDPGKFDLVITDMTMPDMTGDRLAEELMSIRHDIPVILCTGYSEHISEEKAKEIGIKKFILKPLDMKTLPRTIRKVLDN